MITYSDPESVQDFLLEDSETPADQFEVDLLISVKPTRKINRGATNDALADALNIIRVNVTSQFAMRVFNMLADNYDESSLFMGDITFNMEAIL